MVVRVSIYRPPDGVIGNNRGQNKRAKADPEMHKRFLPQFLVDFDVGALGVQRFGGEGGGGGKEKKSEEKQEEFGFGHERLLEDIL
jgi:hypothetical protein